MSEKLGYEVYAKIGHLSWPKLAVKYAALEAKLEVMEQGIRAVETLINESRGVVGLHLNGDEAPWSELRGGGELEAWLIDFDLAAAQGPE